MANGAVGRGNEEKERETKEKVFIKKKSDVDFCVGIKSLVYKGIDHNHYRKYFIHIPKLFGLIKHNQ